MKRVLTVQDISCIGKCSLTVALPIISCIGVETAVLPTAVLSNHTAFKSFSFRDLTSDINSIIDQWEKNDISFASIYTGYLGSFEQLELMNKLFVKFGSKRTSIIVDPCMADNGKLYSGFTKEFAFEMKKLCSKAEIILPNLTEACYMLDIPYKASGYNFDYIKSILCGLAATGAKKIILKGIEFTTPQKEFKNCKGKMGIFCYDSKSKKISCYFHKKLDKCFHGTGDIFASVITGCTARGFSLESSYKLACDFVVKSIEKTLENKNHNWYGVDFEAAFPFLIKQVEKLSKKNG